MYVPGIVPTATLTFPVVGSSVMPGGYVPTVDTVALPVAPSVAGTPFTRSFAATFGTAIPELAVPESGKAVTLAVTVMVAVVVVQVVGVSFSQS